MASFNWISLKSAWAELGPAQSQLVFYFVVFIYLSMHKLFVKRDCYKCIYLLCLLRFALEVHCWLQYLHGNLPFVSSKTSVAWWLHSHKDIWVYMYYPFVFSETYKWRFFWCFVRFALELYCWLQYLHWNLTPSCTCPSVFSNTSICCCLIVALTAGIFDTFMHCFLCSVRLPFVVAW